MQPVVGPVLVKDGGYAFDVWTPEGGLSCSFRYPRAEDAYYARRVEIRYFAKPYRDAPVGCDTVDEFQAALAQRRLSAAGLGATH
jgi:hypothetical protein